MPYIDRSFAFLLTFIVTPLLLLPKVTLVKLGGGQATGLRVDDLILFIAAILIVYSHFKARVSLQPIERYLLAFVTLSLISFMQNRLFLLTGMTNSSSNPLYSLRLFEYFIFFYVGSCFSRFFDPMRLIYFLFIENVTVMFLQLFGFIGAFGIYGYTSNVQDRVFGITSGPWEIAFILNILFCIFLYSNERYKELKYAFYLFFGFAFLNSITGSRIALVGLFMALVFHLYKRYRKQALIAASFMLLFLVLFFILFPESSLVMRSQKVFNLKNFELMSSLFQSIDIEKMEFTQVTEELELSSNLPYDLSWYIRIHKWCYLTKYFLYHPQNYLLGLGPGYCGGAVDGAFLRIVAEYGLIGAYLFYRFLKELFYSKEIMRLIVLTLLFNMLFIDIYMSYKGMSLLFFILGAHFSLQSKPSSSNPFTARKEYSQNMALS